MSETVHPIEILLVEGNPDDVRLIERCEGIIYSQRSFIRCGDGVNDL
jgi:hypothetical protein